ncbi:sugar phosphate isomerase/epimerase family protein [Pseudomonas sp.]|uniref:sugar phosphate isomerase/epimerase family protein n=1 Tax=Pseudomonas sp. TaxID=306 RepID=UPI003C42457F
MRLSISNIAWDTAEDEEIADLLQGVGVDVIDIAPGKYFPVPADAKIQDISKVKNWWAERGIEITGLQALLFGTTGLNVFAGTQSQTSLLNHLAEVCRVGAGLGATRIVFGSPKNRDRSGLSDQEALDVAIPFFRRLGDIAQSFGVNICLEPNPASYGANFMTTSVQTVEVVREVAHPSIGMQLDTGALTMNGEDVFEVLQSMSGLIGHVHISEPNLLPVGDGATDHKKMAQAIRQYLPNHVVTVEMVATAHESHALSVARALGVAIQYYRPEGQRGRV